MLRAATPPRVTDPASSHRASSADPHRASSAQSAQSHGASSARSHRPALRAALVVVAVAGGVTGVACQSAPGSSAQGAPSGASAPAREKDAPPAGPGSGAPRTVAACDASWDAAHRGFASAAAGAPRACKAKEDCVLVPAGCAGCGGVAIAKEGAPRYEADTRPHVQACDDFFRSDCARLSPKPIPSCPAFEARCIAGKCEMRDVREK